MITNIHERILKAPLSKVGELIDRLGSPDDPFWPRDRWPAMEFDRPLGVGSVGGHDNVVGDVADGGARLAIDPDAHLGDRGRRR